MAIRLLIMPKSLQKLKFNYKNITEFLIEYLPVMYKFYSQKELTILDPKVIFC